MIINLSPVFSDDKITAFVSGDKITINDQEFDFSPLSSGTLPADAIDSAHFAGPVFRRKNGEIELTLRLPHAPGASENMTFPEPVRTLKGRVNLPEDQTPVPEPPPPLQEPDEVESDDD